MMAFPQQLRDASFTIRKYLLKYGVIHFPGTYYKLIAKLIYEKSEFRESHYNKP